VKKLQELGEKPGLHRKNVEAASQISPPGDAWCKSSPPPERTPSWNKWNHRSRH